MLKYTGFIFACFLVVGIFVSATNFIQLAVGILIYPLFVLLAYKLFAHRLRSHSARWQVSVPKPNVRSAERAEQTERSSIGIADIDKRVFLKLIGGTGLTLFLFTLFNKKTEDVLFKNLPSQNKISLTDADGRKISPAQRSPLDGYNIAEIEDSTVSFYGFVNKDGAWYVLRMDTVAGSFRYARGERDFPGAWENRENLDYGYFNNVFKP